MMTLKSVRPPRSIALITTKSRNYLLLPLAASICLAGAERAVAQRSWTEPGANDDWDTAANWSTNIPA